MSAPAQTPTVARVLAYLVAHPGSTSAPVAEADALPVRAAELVRAEPWSTTAELAADLDVDVARADQALRTAARRGQIVGETRLYRGRVVRVWRAVGIGAVEL